MKIKASAARAARTRKSPLEKYLSPDYLFIGGSLLIALIIIGVVVVRSFQKGRERSVEIEGVEEFARLTGGHQTTPINYELQPPPGGPHHPVWQNCGVYTEPIATEHAVHSLEHGAVWITYQPDLDEGDVEELQDITRRSSHRLLSPYPDQDSPIVLTAWGFQLKLDSADDDRLMDFIRKYEQGPNTPEPGASCSSGESRTLRELGLQQG